MVITAAMNQSFFTLSLGIAAMEIFRQLHEPGALLTGEAVRICCLDTFVAFMSGMIIFPACFSFGVQPDSGPPSSSSPCPGICEHGRRPSLGRFVLPVYDVRQLYHSARGV